MRIDGKVVLITGASEGIGAACAAEFAASGAKLALNARNQESCAPPRRQEPCWRPATSRCDADRRAVVERTLARFGAIDILINNAGVGYYQPSWEMPMDEVRHLMELNFFAPLALTQLVVPHMRARRTGMIVNVGSIAGKVPLPWMTLYSVSKYALGRAHRLPAHGTEARRHPHHARLPRLRADQFSEERALRPDTAPRGQGAPICHHAETCALAIRHGVERDARTVVTPRAGWLFVFAMRLFPSLVESKMAEMNGTA